MQLKVWHRLQCNMYPRKVEITQKSENEPPIFFLVMLHCRHMPRLKLQQRIFSLVLDDVPCFRTELTLTSVGATALILLEL